MRRVILCTLLALAPMAALADETVRRLTVTGEGVAEAVPDMATIRVGVQNGAATAAEAMASTSAAMAAVLERLAGAGVAPRDVQTSGLSLSPVYDYSRQDGSPPRQVGFEARNGVTVRLRDIAAVGTVLDALVSDGANTLEGITFGLQDPVPAMDEARRRAVAEARRKAELYAEAAGVRLERLVSLDEARGLSPRPEMFARAAAVADAAVPVAEGELSLSASVTMVYEIRDR